MLKRELRLKRMLENEGTMHVCSYLHQQVFSFSTNCGQIPRNDVGFLQGFCHGHFPNTDSSIGTHLPQSCLDAVISKQAAGVPDTWLQLLRIVRACRACYQHKQVFFCGSPTCKHRLRVCGGLAEALQGAGGSHVS